MFSILATVFLQWSNGQTCHLAAVPRQAMVMLVPFCRINSIIYYQHSKMGALPLALSKGAFKTL